MIRPWISVILMSIYPVLIVVGANIDEVILFDIFFPIAISVFVSISLYWLFYKLLGKKDLSAIIIVVMLFYFYFYGHIFYTFIHHLHFNEVTIGRHRFFFPIWCFLSLLSLFVIYRFKGSLNVFVRFVNYLLIFLVIISILPILSALPSIFIKNNSIGETNDISSVSSISRRELPNIYYIVLDGYAAFDTLKNVYNFDNSSFHNSLENEGFFVADRSTANHSYTYLSLSSSLNMKYMDFMGDSETYSEAIRENRDSIDRNQVAKLLKSSGYKYITFESGYSTSSNSNIADLNIPCARFSEFDRTIIKTTLLDPFFLYGGVRNTILCQFDTIEKVAKSGNNFIFSHIIAPHPPFVFDSQGDKVGMNKGLNPWSDQNAYVEQTKFVNVKVLELIKRIKITSKIDPIIIIQSDHGPASQGTEEMINPSDALLRERMRILNVYYVPDEIEKKLYKEITPVNTFRLILSELLKINLPLLEDKNYFTAIGQDQEKLIFDDVTEITQYE